MIGKDFAQQLFNLRDRVAFVTGAGSGIGQTIACSLASAGARVVCFDLRDDGGLAETVSHIESIGGQACSFTGDVRQIADLRAAVALAKSRYGRLDIAVNAAGIANANPAPRWRASSGNGLSTSTSPAYGTPAKWKRN